MACCLFRFEAAGIEDWKHYGLVGEESHRIVKTVGRWLHSGMQLLGKRCFEHHNRHSDLARKDQHKGRRSRRALLADTGYRENARMWLECRRVVERGRTAAAGTHGFGYTGKDLAVLGLVVDIGGTGLHEEQASQYGSSDHRKPHRLAYSRWYYDYFRPL